MAGRNASPLYLTLRGRSANLCNGLATELANLCDFKATDSACDVGDMAFEASSDEMSSQLAQLGARELSQTERAVGLLLQGRYGVCEKCRKKIPAARLNALPDATLCIDCEGEVEKEPDWLDHRGTENWDRVFDSQALMKDEHINLAELEIGMRGNRCRHLRRLTACIDEQ